MQATYYLQRGTQLGTALSLAAIVTGALLIFMCTLIAMDPPVVKEYKRLPMSVVMDPPKPIEVQVEDRLPRPEEVEPEPQAPSTPTTFESIEVDHSLALLAPPLKGKHTTLSGPDTGRATAMFMIAPTYPNRAQRLGVEGYVDLMFDITPTGKTENIRVIHAQPQGYFESSSIKTLKKWKYKPALDDGIAIAQKNKTTRIKFELAK